MVRSYNRHEPTAVFGLIASNTAVRPVLDADGKKAYVAALEDILVWDVKKGQLLATWHEVAHTSSVTALARNPQDKDVFAVGYADGSIRLWRASTSASYLTFNGHKGSVNCLVWDHNGMRLASAGQDTTIIAWDVIAEQGLFRLHGHRNAVTDLVFLPDPTQTSAAHSRLLASVSKDSLLKVWDFDLQHCIETVAPGDGELWSLCAVHASQLPKTEQGSSSFVLVTGGSEGQIKMWDCAVSHKEEEMREDSQQQASSSNAQPNVIPLVRVHLQGTLAHTSTKRVAQLAFVPLENFAANDDSSPTSRQLAALTSDRTLQTFTFRSAHDIRKKIARRTKRAKEKGEGKPVNPVEPPKILTWTDQVESGEILRPSDGRFRSFTIADSRSNGAKEGKASHASLLFVLSTNALEVQRLSAKGKAKDTDGVQPVSGPAYSLDLAGHRNEIRALGFSNSGELVASACSSGLVKVWNLATGSCLRTMPGGYALCLTWLHDDSHIIVGCKDGTIHTYDVSSGNEVDSIAAHDGPVWSISIRPDGNGFVSGSADKTAKFWNFTSEAEDGGEDEDPGEREASAAGRAVRLALEHVRTLKMTDDILSVAISPDGRLLALALLDSTVKIFFADTLKFFLSLYGHKLPVLTLDFSQDSKLIITGSADKNVKIWGLDFGDCHRSLIAHGDSVMSVSFEKGQQGGGLMGGREGDSHRFWSVGKDGLLKFWDGDNFEAVQTLRGHHGEIWALATDGKGSKLVTAGADKSIRLWEKTDEPLFLEEEREKELETVYQNAGSNRNDDERGIGELAGDEQGARDPAQFEATIVSSSNDASLTTGERVIEAIEIADRDRIEQAAPLPPPRNAALLAGLQEGDEQTAARYVFRVVEKIPSTQLNDVLLLLPFSAVTSLFEYIDVWLQKEWSLALSARILFFLMRTHHSQIVSNNLLKGSLASLRTSLRNSLTKSKTLVGYNMSGLKFAHSQVLARKQANFDLFSAAPGGDNKEATSFAVKRKLQI